jgi:hypothetical protein
MNAGFSRGMVKVVGLRILVKTSVQRIRMERRYQPILGSMDYGLAGSVDWASGMMSHMSHSVQTTTSNAVSQSKRTRKVSAEL